MSSDVNHQLRHYPLRGFTLSRRHVLELAVVMVVVQVIDTLVNSKLLCRGILSPDSALIVRRFEETSIILFLFFSSIIFGAIFMRLSRWVGPAIVCYLVFCSLQLLVDLGTLVGTTNIHRGETIMHLWDVAAIYFMSISVFAAWYWLIDITTPGGAFIVEKRLEYHERLILVDYLFISFVTNSSPGPVETPVTGRAKVAMMVQLFLAVTLLSVLLARTVTLGG